MKAKDSLSEFQRNPGRGKQYLSLIPGREEGKGREKNKSHAAFHEASGGQTAEHKQLPDPQRSFRKRTESQSVG